MATDMILIAKINEVLIWKPASFTKLNAARMILAKKRLKMLNKTR